MRLWHVTAVLVLALLAALWGLWDAWGDETRATSRAEVAEALAAQYSSRLVALRDSQAAGQERTQDFKEVLDASPDWRDGAVPGPVTDGLCRHLRCK